MRSFRISYDFAVVCLLVMVVICCLITVLVLLLWRCGLGV